MHSYTLIFQGAHVYAKGEDEFDAAKNWFESKTVAWLHGVDGELELFGQEGTYKYTLHTHMTSCDDVE